MAELVSDELWAQIEPLLPPEPEPSLLGGRPRVTNRQTLTGIVFVLRTGIPWQSLPTEMNCGSGSTCWRRFAEWTELEVWSKLHAMLLRQLGQAAKSISNGPLSTVPASAQFLGGAHGAEPDGPCESRL